MSHHAEAPALPTAPGALAGIGHVLFVSGDPAAMSAPHAIAIVGTRRPTEAGRRIAAQIGGAGPSGDPAGGPIQGPQHLLMKPARIFAGEIGPGCSGQNTARRFGDFAPRAAQVGQRPVEHALEEAGGSGIGHGGSCGSGGRRTRREGWPEVNRKKVDTACR